MAQALLAKASAANPAVQVTWRIKPRQARDLGRWASQEGRRPRMHWVTTPYCLLIAAHLAIGGCTPAGVVGGTGAGAVLGHALHCYGLGMVNNCPTPTPPEILAARNNDVETLRRLISEQPRIVTDAGRLDPILAAAAGSDALDVVRLLVPTYASVDRELSHPIGGTMLSQAVFFGGCNTVMQLLDWGAKLPSSDSLRHLVWSSTVRRKSDACLLAAKKIIGVGYQPSLRELNASLRIALGDGWEGKTISDQWNVPNYEMATYLRSLGAAYVPPQSHQ